MFFRGCVCLLSSHSFLFQILPKGSNSGHTGCAQIISIWHPGRPRRPGLEEQLPVSAGCEGTEVEPCQLFLFSLVPGPASIASLVFLCQPSFRNGLLFTFWPWIKMRKKKLFISLLSLPKYKWCASHRVEFIYNRWGKLRHREVDRCVLALLNCCVTKKGT